MNKRQSRHTTKAISEPLIIQNQQAYQQYPSFEVQDKPLCKITFTLDINEEKEVKVYPHMTTTEIAEKMCQMLGCDYEQCVQEEIKSQLHHILRQEANQTTRKDILWRQNMQRILNISNSKGSSTFQNQIITSFLDKKKKLYFDNNNSKSHAFLREKKTFNTSSENKINNIYQRSKAKIQTKQEKINKFKMDKENKEMSKCTFHPKINRRLRQKSQISEDTFQRLYSQATQIRNKRQQKLKTLCSQEEERLSQLSFAPEINECSKEICKMRSYTSLLNFESDDQSIRPKILRKKKLQKTKFTFEPQLSANTKKMTENLPKLEDRLFFKKKKENRLETSKSTKSMHGSKKSVNKSKIRKQIFIIDDEEKKTQKKKCENMVKVKKMVPENDHIVLNLTQYLEKEEEKQLLEESSFLQMSTNKKKSNTRSEELYNNRKKIIFSTIFDYLTICPSVSMEDFVKRKENQSKSEINYHNIVHHPFLPGFVKEMFEPITKQMDQLSVTLEKQEFIWALEKLYDLNVGDKGMLLGWGIKLIPQNNK